MHKAALKLADAIRRDGRTAGQIAAHAGISQCTLSLVRTGRRQARVETALKIAHTLGTTLEAIGFTAQAQALKGGDA